MKKILLSQDFHERELLKICDFISDSPLVLSVCGETFKAVVDFSIPDKTVRFLFVPDDANIKPIDAPMDYLKIVS